MAHRYWRIRKDAGLGKWCAEYAVDPGALWYRAISNRSHAYVVMQVRQIILNLAENDWAPDEAPKPSERAYKLTKAQREELVVRSGLKGWNRPIPARERVGRLFQLWTKENDLVVYEGEVRYVRPTEDEKREP